MRELEPVLDQAVEYARERGVAARPVVKIGRRISHALVQTAREEECNFLIIGQPNVQGVFERIVSTIVERVLHDAPCQVGVVYGSIAADGVSQIIVPVTTGPNSTLAAELAPAFADWFGVSADALTVTASWGTDAHADVQEAKARDTLEAAEFEGDLQVLRRSDVQRGIVNAIVPGQLVVLGAPSSGPVIPILGDTIPALIAQRGRNPVIVVRDVEEQRVHRFERVFFART